MVTIGLVLKNECKRSCFAKFYAKTIFIQNKLPVKFGTRDFSFSFEWLGNYIVFVYWNVRLTKVALLYLALVYYCLFKWRFEYTLLSITLFLMYCYCLLKRKIKYMSLFIALSICSMITNIHTYILIYTVRWRAILYCANDFICFLHGKKSL